MVCRTLDECFAAGWADGADDAPLTQQETERLAALHSPYLRPHAEALLIPRSALVNSAAPGR